MNPVVFFIDSAKLNREWYINKADSLSGTDKSIINVANGCAENGVLTILMCTKPPSDNPSSSIKLIFVKSYLDAFEQSREHFAKHFIFPIKNEPEQINVVQESKPGLSLVGWAHNTPSFEWMSTVGDCPNLTAIIAVSDGQAASMAIYRAFRKVIAIPNLIGIEDCAETSERSSQSVFTVAFVGALTPSKGFHWLAQIWPNIRAKYPSARLVVCGSASLYGKRNDSVGTNGLADNDYEKLFLNLLGGDIKTAASLGVNFLGSLPRDQLKAVLLDSSIVVVNPNWIGSIETFCLSAVEALALSRPVIGGYAGALPETVGHGRGGLLSASAIELQQNICRLIDDKKLRDQLAKNGNKWVQHYYSNDNVINRWREFFGGNIITRYYSNEKSAFPSFYYARRILGIILPSSGLRILKTIKARFNKGTW